jgi:hypothetical protein
VLFRSPLKTNQTTSFTTGDDGDTQRGRAVGLLTLASNNPFGNTNRFTYLDGTQTYTVGIVLDWTTYDGTVVLGYDIANISISTTWATHSTQVIAQTLGGYTGWRMSNAFELINIANFASGNNAMVSFNYSPLNISDGVAIHTSTTGERADGLTVSSVARLGANTFALLLKSSSGRRVGVRYFTNAELGI